MQVSQWARIGRSGRKEERETGVQFLVAEWGPFDGVRRTSNTALQATITPFCSPSIGRSSGKLLSLRLPFSLYAAHLLDSIVIVIRIMIVNLQINLKDLFVPLVA